MSLRRMLGCVVWVLGVTASVYGIPTNGDFSAGLSGWTVSGNVQVIGGIAVFTEVSPTESSRIYQDVSIPVGAASLSFEYFLGTEGTPNGQAFTDAFSFFNYKD